MMSIHTSAVSLCVCVCVWGIYTSRHQMTRAQRVMIPHFFARMGRRAVPQICSYFHSDNIWSVGSIAWILRHTQCMNGQTVDNHWCVQPHTHTHTEKGTQKWLQNRSGHKFGQGRQCNYNLAHEISLLVFPFPTTNHMDKGRLGKKKKKTVSSLSVGSSRH